MMKRNKINTKRFGIIDIGTNSVRLLIADFFYDKNDFNVIITNKVTTRLGEGLYNDFHIQKKSLTNTTQAIKVFNHQIKQHNCDIVYCFATSAIRDAKNQAEVISYIKAEADIDVNVISGETEALFSATGASVGINCDKLNVFDIGGGSTEIILKSQNEIKKISIDIGCVRLKEMFPSSADATDYVEHVLGKIDTPLQENVLTVFTGGTADNLSDILRDENTLQGEYNGTKIDVKSIKELYSKIQPMAAYERIEALKWLDPNRADIIDFGLLIIIKLSERFNFESVLFKKSSNLEGALIHIANK